MSQQAAEHAATNRKRYLAEFFELLRIPSISTDPAFATEVQNAADWLVNHMLSLGLDNVEAVSTNGHPIVCGEWMNAGDGAPTVLFYAHYDVQPADPLELWDSPPFEPTERDGKIYARGVVDDKIGVIACLKAIESFIATAGGLPVNIKCLFEGEEEIGSPSALGFIRAHPDRIDADTIVICDGSGPPDFPMVILSCRGLIGAEISVIGPPQDMHSGSVGGLVANPIHTVARIIASLHDGTGKVAIPGFHEGIQEIDPEEKRRMAEMEAEYLRAVKGRLGDFVEWGDPSISPLERISVRPTCDANGVYGGYQGDGLKTIIPSKAGFKVTMRLAPGQDPEHIIPAFIRHVEGFSTAATKISIDIRKKSWPATSVLGSPEVNALKLACRDSWGKEPLLVRTGGTVPIAGTLQRETGLAPVFLAPGIGGLIHSPNEFMHAGFFNTAILLVISFLSRLGAR